MPAGESRVLIRRWGLAGVISAVDTNVLLDILVADSDYYVASLAALEHGHERGRLIIGGVVYAELAVHFPSTRQLDSFLDETRIDLVPTTRESSAAAAKAWGTYTSHRPPGIQCHECGTTLTVACPSCGRRLQPRRHIMVDFLIGAHALVHANRLITRDRGFYRRYFDGLTVVP